MQLLSLELENVKSYEHAEIHFTEGLNAICGHNGSGKTTILEAIGYVLFDYLPYDQKAFVREGAKAGTVRVRLVAVDGRAYEVVRRTGGAYYVSDIESGLRLAERKEYVADWVRANALCIDGSEDIEALFMNAVGVPQGMMTADFQKPPVQRKKVFDSLLHVEEYREAYQTLNDTARYMKEQSAVLDTEIAGLRTDVERIPDTEHKLAALVDRLRAGEERLRDLGRELASTQDRKAVMDALETRLRELEQERERAVGRVERLGTEVESRRERLASAEAAAAVVAETRPDSERHMAASTRLDELNDLRRERDALHHQQSDAKAAMHAAQGTIESAQKQWREAVDAGDAAAALTDHVERQGTLEEQLHAAHLRAEQLELLLNQIATGEAAITRMETQCTELRATLQVALAAAQEAEQLPVVREEIARCDRELAAIGPVRKRRDELKADGVKLRTQYDTLQADVARRNDLLREVEGLKPVAERYESMHDTLMALREERAAAAATIEYQTVARAQLTRSHCPLLDLQCPVVAADASTLEAFDGRVADLRVRLTALDAEFADLEVRVGEAQTASRRLQELQLDVSRLDVSVGRVAEVEEQLIACRKDYAQVAEIVDRQPAFERRLAELRAEERRLQTANELGAQVPAYRERLTEAENRLEGQRVELRALRERHEALAPVQTEIAELEHALRSLGDPRGMQQQLLGKAADREKAEREIEEAQRRLQDATDRMRAIVGQLQRFESLDAELESLTAVRDSTRAAHERYLGAVAEAGTVEERRQQLQAARENLDACRDAETALADRLKAERAQYDEAEHESLKVRFADLKGEIGREEGTRNENERERRETEATLDRLRLRECDMREREARRDDLASTLEALAFIRATINDAGPAVTETLLQNISATAGDVFSEIMDDHAAELRWERDYEIVVQKGAETRRFGQLSGGEQMSAALAVRLALLKEMTGVNVAFFDEPTQNMDADRRGNLAGQIRQVQGFEQLVVISHDDTFEHDTDNLIRLRKEYDRTVVGRD